MRSVMRGGAKILNRDIETFKCMHVHAGIARPNPCMTAAQF